MSCSVLFDSAWATCFATQDAECQKLAGMASNIECLISKAAASGEFSVIVNKCEIWDEEETIIKGLRSSCYKVEFIPYGPKINDCSPCCTSNNTTTPQPPTPPVPGEDPGPGYYKISWCICACSNTSSSLSSSSCCEGLPTDCYSSSYSSKIL
jgi:hypothetical protein